MAKSRHEPGCTDRDYKWYEGVRDQAQWLVGLLEDTEKADLLAGRTTARSVALVTSGPGDAWGGDELPDRDDARSSGFACGCPDELRAWLADLADEHEARIDAWLADQ
jgi:hypothetical protein